jgi:hypothetical protein
MIITASFTSSSSQSTSGVPNVVYYSLSVAFNFFNLYLNIRLFRTDLFKESILKPLEEEKRLMLSNSSSTQ